MENQMHSCFESGTLVKYVHVGVTEDGWCRARPNGETSWEILDHDPGSVADYVMCRNEDIGLILGYISTENRYAVLINEQIAALPEEWLVKIND